LALSKNNPSIEEAESAALKAQELMVKYRITMAEIDEIENVEDIVEEKIDVGTGNKWKYTLSGIVAKNFRCKYFCIGKSCIVFYGYEKDAKIAAMSFDMLFRVGNRESVKYYQKQRQEYINHGRCFDGRGIKNAFLNGFLLGIKEVLEKQCTALMVVIPEEVEKNIKTEHQNFIGLMPVLK